MNYDNDKSASNDVEYRKYYYMLIYNRTLGHGSGIRAQIASKPSSDGTALAIVDIYASRNNKSDCEDFVKLRPLFNQILKVFKTCNYIIETDDGYGRLLTDEPSKNVAVHRYWLRLPEGASVRTLVEAIKSAVSQTETANSEFRRRFIIGRFGRHLGHEYDTPSREPQKYPDLLPRIPGGG